MNENRRAIVTALAGVPLIGCTLAARTIKSVKATTGESGAYNTWSESFPVEDSQILEMGDQPIELSRDFLLRPRGPYDSLLMHVGSPYHFLASSGHKIPEEVEVSWHEPPPPGGRMYSGALKGPYRVAVRARIPSDVLRQAGSDDRVVCISFGVGGDKILLNWALVEYDGQSRFPRERKILQYGGDSFQ